MRAVAVSVAGNCFPHLPTQLTGCDALAEVNRSVLTADPPNLFGKRGRGGGERKTGREEGRGREGEGRGEGKGRREEERREGERGGKRRTCKITTVH